MIDINKGENIAIVGPNGGGKSMLVNGIKSDRLKHLGFHDTYGSETDRHYFLQQRWNSMEIDPEMPTVDGKPIVTLSSGELRKYQIRRALSTRPEGLILENPFIGLDSDTRQQLKDHLKKLSTEQHLQIILVLSKWDEVPEFINTVYWVEDMVVSKKMTREEFFNHTPQAPVRVLSKEKEKAILGLPQNANRYDADEVIGMRKVSIRYGERTILKDLDWTVKNGERWALSGQNGSGKSTLLSLVCADNPQAYACDISLFGHQRGSGETIWEIKKHIGYVSPEMHRSYKRDIPAIRIVASGLTDSIGLYVKPKEGDYDICRFWMDIFGLKGKEDISFMKLSSGEQRLVLLARAFVKDPELLILDEPLHGLDIINRRMVKDIIETFCKREDKTFIMVTHYEEELPANITNHLYLKRNV